MKNYNVLLTGATGFLGSALAARLKATKSDKIQYIVKPVIRNPHSVGAPDDSVIRELTVSTDWLPVLVDQHVVVHTAARVHVMNHQSDDPLLEYRKVNVDGTLNLARQAAEAGIRRFIFVSSIKVNGEQTTLDQSFTADQVPAPQDAYGISKLEAERALQGLAKETGMEVVIIRPPLVYGPGVKGNFAMMIKLLDKRLPLPLGAINNKRSLVALDNLVDLIITCINHPAAANQVFLAGDGKDLSTSELLREIGKAMGKPARLIPVPSGLLMFGAGLLGKKAIAQRVLGSLQVDNSKARNLLGWEPPISVEEGLRRCFDSENAC